MSAERTEAWAAAPQPRDCAASARNAASRAALRPIRFRFRLPRSARIQQPSCSHLHSSLYPSSQVCCKNPNLCGIKKPVFVQEEPSPVSSPQSPSKSNRPHVLSRRPSRSFPPRSVLLARDRSSCTLLATPRLLRIPTLGSCLLQTECGTDSTRNEI